MRRRCLSWPALLVKLSPHTGHSRQSTGLRLRGLWFEASSEDDDDDDVEEEEECSVSTASSSLSSPEIFRREIYGWEDFDTSATTQNKMFF